MTHRCITVQRHERNDVDGPHPRVNTVMLAHVETESLPGETYRSR